MSPKGIVVFNFITESREVQIKKKNAGKQSEAGPRREVDSSKGFN